MKQFDPRLNAIRSDLADIAFEGQIEVPRFARGVTLRVAAPQAPVRSEPSDGAMLLTEALCGERVTLFDETEDGWAWVQLTADRYVGWMPRDALAESGTAPTHKVSALRTFAFARPDIKAPPIAVLPFGAQVSLTGQAEDRNATYGLVDPAGAVVVQHLAPLDRLEPDWVSVAERFLGTPYLWGGKTSGGIDCSGLVQVALHAGGTTAPRDTDMQEAALGTALPAAGELPRLERGDLVFWKGHVGIMRDSDTLLHANAHHMQVAAEPLQAAIERLTGRGSEVTSVRRIGRD